MLLVHYLKVGKCVGSLCLIPFPPLLQVALVFPNNDPAAFMVAFYGCLLAEVVPVPIEVPLTRKVRETVPRCLCYNCCQNKLPNDMPV